MKKGIILLLMVAAFQTSAQGLFIQPTIGYSKTSIYNKEDTKRVDYT